MTVTLIESGLQRLLNSEAGPIGRDIIRRGEAVLQRAQENASGGVVESRSGQLAASLQLQIQPGPAAVVSTPLPYGLYLEQGTPPHVIAARNARLLVSEPSNPDPLRQAQFSVNHPGFGPKRWLSSALEAARV